MSLNFSTALSGLRANSDALGVAGNNIANANTTAFKSHSINFADVFHGALSAKLNGAGLALQIGNGVLSTGTTTNFGQGSLNDSGSPVTAAMQGNGYFVVTTPDGVQAYTRAGNFTLDREGYLVTPSNAKVQGYQAVNGTVPPDALLSPLRAPLGELAAPVATTEISFRMNLSANDAVGSQFHAPVQVYDSLGVAHTLDLVYTKTGNGAYTLTATVDGNAAQLNADGGGAAASAALTFDANGQLTAPTTLAVVADQTQLNGATMPDINMGLYTTNPDGSQGPSLVTNYNATSTVASSQQNGFPSGTLAGLSFSSEGDGTLMAVYTNGQTRTVGRLAIATFTAQEGLRRFGDNLYSETLASGVPSLGIASTGGRGAVIGGVLEESNVDIASEFTDLIVAQRGFQANSRVINSINQTLQEVLQIV